MDSPSLVVEGLAQIFENLQTEVIHTLNNTNYMYFLP